MATLQRPSLNFPSARALPPVNKPKEQVSKQIANNSPKQPLETNHKISAFTHTKKIRKPLNKLLAYKSQKDALTNANEV
jgi:hypothetical protein